MNAPARSIGEVLGDRAARSPRTGQPVWRNSYYKGQIEDRIWRPFMGGNVRGAKRRIGAILKSARELERRTRRERQRETPGVRNGLVGQIGLAVLEVLYNRYLDYRTGRLDPAITTIAEAVGHSYAAVHAALRRLRSAGFLHWVRRSEPIEDAAGAGPQVKQISNAYALLLPKPLERMVRHLLGSAPLPDDADWAREQHAKDWQAMLDGMSSAEFHAATWAGDELAGETLARIAALLDKERESSGNVETGGI
ncbi:MAG TPA: replication protein A [Sphingopyxis sp.]|nr:replication protein A [Sphingopyxis sp.]HMP43882.1 replication protein A [Sphingopyxis sp.]HMQ18517.1 replication protein A [Sphingopyxis sp.]